MQPFDPKAHLIIRTEYLPIQWRLLWFRQENPKGKIESRAITLEPNAAIFEAYVEREDGGCARAHGSETAADWHDFIEKAETKAVGRALAAVGYGTQFSAAEFDAGEHSANTAPDTPTREKAETHVSANKTVQPSSTEPKQELLAIKADVKELGIAHTPTQWADWKRKVLDEDTSDGQLKPHHLAKLHGAVETLKRQEATTQSKHLEPALKDRLNALYTRAKAIAPSCESANDFKVYLAHLLKLNRIDVATLQTLDLDYVEADIVKREAAAMEEVA
ncbi:MAG: hypothetical protein JO202_01595 [Ktedonobacteraceae bacterium]|nr:hypothetical protein [Ktedonobacteraceae bacterium]